VNLGVTLSAAQFFTTSDTFDLTVGGPVNLNGFSLGVNGAGTLALTGPVSGGGGLIKIGRGTLSLAGNNTYTGVTDIREGFLEVRSNTAFGATGSGNDTQLSNNTTTTLLGGSLAIPEAFRFGQTGAGSVLNIVASNSGSATLSGPLNVIGGATITGQATNPLVIAGPLTGSGFNASLNLANVVVAATSVSPAFTGNFNGSFEFDGQAPGASSNPSNLTGTGTLGMVTAAGLGTVSPGINGIGTLHSHGLAVSPAGGTHIPVPPGHLAIKLSAAGAGQVAVIGSVSLGGVLDLTVAPGFTPATGARYRIIDNDGTDPVMFTFSGLTEGAVVTTVNGTALRITYHGGDGNDVELVAGSAPVSGRYAVAAGVGGLPIVSVYDGSTLVRSFFAYDQSFRGGVNVATADVTNDGVPDTITAPGFGGGPVVRIWDGATGAMVRQFNAYDPAFRGGVNISTGLINGDVIPDIITGAGRTGGPHVKAFDALGNTLVSFLAYDPSFTGGVSVAGGPQLIITGAGPGGGPHVKSFNAQGTLLYNFFAYATNFAGGINVAYNSVSGTILTAPKSGMAPLVKSFFLAGVPAFQFLAYSANFTGGVNLAVLPIGQGGTTSIITGPGVGGGPDVRIWSDNGATIQREFLAFDPAFLGGVYVG
jgi:autotransporter-associated beta strand protein